MWYNRLKSWYEKGRITERYLDAAVMRKWITEEQKQKIIAGE